LTLTKHKEIVPDCLIQPTHDDTAQLVEELVIGQIDAAIMRCQSAILASMQKPSSATGS
jgi:hypothetical protein